MTEMGSSSPLVKALDTARSRIITYRDRRVRLTESDTIRVLILPIIEALGWDTSDVEEVKSEYRHKTSDNPVDYALFLQSAPVLFVEAKALDITLDDRRPLVQTLNYANTAGIDWCVLTNGAEYRIYKVHAPVEAEEKLFLTIQLDDPSGNLEPLAEALSLLSRDRMRVRAINALWSEWRVDRQVEAVLDTITGDEAFMRLVAKRIDGVTAGEVRASLRRSGLRSFYPRMDAFMIARDADHVEPDSSEAVAHNPGPAAQSGRTRRMKTAEMVERGLLPIGTELTIKGRSGSAATVVDGKRVEFRGDVMSFNEWAARRPAGSRSRSTSGRFCPTGGCSINCAAIRCRTRRGKDLRG